MLSKVRMFDLGRVEDNEYKALYTYLRTYKTENRWIKSKMLHKLHRSLEDKNKREKERIWLWMTKLM